MEVEQGGQPPADLAVPAVAGLRGAHVRVRLQRMRDQLELSRSVVAALDATPRCRELDAAAVQHGVVRAAARRHAEAIDRALLREGIATVPGADMHAPRTHVRLVFGSDEPLLGELVGGLARAVAGGRS